MKGGHVYILTNKNKTTLYVGVTSMLRYRLWQHKTKYYPKSFSARYELSILVFYESFNSIKDATNYERYLKGKSRLFKETVINGFNPNWVDLSEEVDEKL
jgi:putative endonuclease